MPVDDGRDPRDAAAAPVQPGEFSALLLELARAPEASFGAGWDGVERGTRVGRFELVREIGRGGFGAVWEARDPSLGRVVALKLIHPRDVAAVREERMLREAEAAARLAHPNIVTLFDVGQSELGPYLVYELLRGRTLCHRIAEGALPPRDVVHIATEIASGIAHAHEHGVVHRDLKPANVFLCDDGRVKVLDFGLAHALGRRRQAGGTPAYMAPEQQSGAPEDERTDVFALGVISFEMLTGTMPFPRSRREGLAPSAPAPLLDVPRCPALGELVSRMLDADPLRRPRDGEEVLRALRTLDAATEGTAEQAPTQVRVRRRPSMPRAALAAATLLSVVALLAVLLTTRRHDTAPPAGSGTRSLEAYQHHLRAIELRMRDCDFVAAEREERRALALDPNFGAAHMQLGLLLLFTSDSLEDSNAHFHAAHALADRMPDRERRIILLDKYITPTMPLPGDPREHQRVAMDGFRELVERYPQDPYVLYMASFAESHFGNWDSAIEHMRRSLEADPGQCYVAYQLVGMLYRTDRGSEAIAVARRAAGVRPNAANLALLASALAVAGERDEAARYARESLGLSSSVQGRYGDWTALLALAASGYPDEAADTARRLAPRAATPFLASELQRLEALALGLQGRVREAIQRWPGDERRTRPGVDVRATLLGVGRDRLDAPDALRRLRERPTAVLLAGELALHGDAQAGRDAAATLDPGSPPAAYHRAVALASERRWTDAIPALRAMLLRYGERTVGLPDPRVSYQLQIRLLLGEGLLETGHPEEALEALRSADPFGVSSEGAAAENLPRIWILRAHVLEQLGRPGEAVEILDRLLHQWRNADPELPLLSKARTLRERLAGQATGATASPSE